MFISFVLICFDSLADLFDSTGRNPKSEKFFCGEVDVFLREELLGEDFFAFWPYAWDAIKERGEKIFAFEFVVKGVGKTVGFIPYSLKDMKGGRVFGEDNRFALVGGVDLFVLFCKRNNRKGDVEFGKC